MAAIVVPVVEVVVLRVLAALGVGVAAGAAGDAAIEQARKRQEEADKAKSGPISRTDSTTKEKEKCKDCPPDHGALAAVNHSMSENSKEYQARITGFAPGTEWKFEGTDFDGFQSGLCLLQEAKGNFDQFFDKEGEFHYPFQGGIFMRMEKQAKSQSMIVRRNAPASLTYYFQTPLAYQQMKIPLDLLGITSIYEP